MFTIFIVVVAAAVFAMYVQHDRQQTRRIQRSEPRRIAELPEDTPGRIAGIAQPAGEALTAPLSGRACVYYLARVERRLDAPAMPGPSGGPPVELTVGAATHPAATHTQAPGPDAPNHPTLDDPGWTTIASETAATTFVIQDETGRAVIDPAHAKFDLRFEPSVAPSDRRSARAAGRWRRAAAALPRGHDRDRRGDHGVRRRCSRARSRCSPSGPLPWRSTDPTPADQHGPASAGDQ
jgi:hypothetical protein